jgi:pyruvate-formate lyase
MAEQLFRLGSTSWFVLVDTTKEQILETFNKAQTAATIAAITAQLESYPEPTQAEKDVKDILWLIDNFTAADPARKDRVKALVQAMYQSYQEDPQFLDAVQLRLRLEKLTKLYGEM